MESKIIQIIPAPTHWKSAYRDENKEMFYMPIVCIALNADGDVFLMDMDDSGEIAEITTNHVIHKNEVQNE